MPALSSSPGHAPIQEASRLAVANVAAVGPTSAMICCAESTPSPGNAGEALHDVLMRTQQPREFLGKVFQVRLDDVHLVERHREEPPVDRMQVGAGAERVAYLIWRRVQARTAERSDGARVGVARRDGAEHAAGYWVPADPKLGSIP